MCVFIWLLFKNLERVSSGVWIMAGWSTLRDVNGVKNRQYNSKFRADSVNVDSNSMQEGKDDEDWDGMLRRLFDRILVVILRDATKNAYRPIPALLGDGRRVDLFRLFYLVRERGGFDSVSREKLWGLVTESLDLDFRFSASLKLIYFKYLDGLDQYLNRIGKDGNFVNKSSECIGDLELLSVELEKRFRGLSVDGSKLAKIDNEVISAGCDTNLMNNLQFSGVKKDNKLLDDPNVATCDDDEKISKGEGDRILGRSDPGSNKRKRNSQDWLEMLNWLKQVAKNPRGLSNGRMPHSCRLNENGGKESRDLALLAREAMLKRSYADSKDDGCSSNQKKQKIHPTIYNDPSSGNLESVRFSKRVPALAKSPRCSCCDPSSTKENRHANHCKSISELKNDPQEDKKEKTPPNLPVPKPSEPTTDGPSPDKRPVEKNVNVGPQFQAEISPWTGTISEKDCDQLGTRIWPPINWEENNLLDFYSVWGKGRPEFCDCPFPGSVECVRFHTAENKLKLKHELGRAFYEWKFDKMGEVVSLSWTPQEEEKFKSVMSTTPLSTGKLSFPKKTRKEFIDYYFNVFLQRKRSYQNRVTPKSADSDDELSEFGSVGELYGHAASNASRSCPLKCIQNEQCLDIDMTVKVKKR